MGRKGRGDEDKGKTAGQRPVSSGLTLSVDEQVAPEPSGEAKVSGLTLEPVSAGRSPSSAKPSGLTLEEVPSSGGRRAVGPTPISLEQAAMPSRPVMPAGAAPVKGPWTDARVVRRWLLTLDEHPDAHGFFLLGQESTESYAEYQTRIEQCLRVLRAKQSRNDQFATQVLDQDNFQRIQTLDEAGWRSESERYKWHNPEWYRLDERIGDFTADDFYSLSEQEIAFRECERIGISREELERHIRETFPDCAWEQVGESRDFLFNVSQVFGDKIRDSVHFIDAVTEDQTVFEAAARERSLLETIAQNLHHRDGQRMSDAMTSASGSIQAFARRHAGIVSGTNRDALWLWCTLWALGERRVRVPHAWEGTWIADVDELVERSGAQVDDLVPAIDSGVLPLWLAQVAEREDLVRDVLSAGDRTDLEAWRLLWALGETRIGIGGQSFANGIQLRDQLVGDASGELRGSFDRALSTQLLNSWAIDKRHTDVVEAIAKCGQRGTAELRVQAFVWSLGHAELVAGVASRDDMVEFARHRRSELLGLIRSKHLMTWVMTRDVADDLNLVKEVIARQEEGGWSDTRLLHEWLWAVGLDVLLVDATSYTAMSPLIAAVARKDAGAEAHLSTLTALTADGTFPEWAKRHGVDRTAEVIDGGASLQDADLALTMLWHSGLLPLHDPRCGWIDDVGRLGGWADVHKDRLLDLLGSNRCQNWLWYRDRTVQEGIKGILEAMEAGSCSAAEAVESCCQALGQAKPTYQLSATELDFGIIGEGDRRTRSFKVTHTGGRGKLFVSGMSLDSHIDHFQFATSLDPGESHDVRCTVSLPVGQRSVSRDSVLELTINQQQVERIPVRYRSKANLRKLVTYGLAGGFIGAMALGIWRFVLYILIGQLAVRSDGTVNTDVQALAALPHLDIVGKFTMALLTIIVAGTLLTIGYFRRKAGGWENI
jgi:hypothetical protein